MSASSVLSVTGADRIASNEQERHRIGHRLGSTFRFGETDGELACEPRCSSWPRGRIVEREKGDPALTNAKRARRSARRNMLLSSVFHVEGRG